MNFHQISIAIQFLFSHMDRICLTSHRWSTETRRLKRLHARCQPHVIPGAAGSPGWSAVGPGFAVEVGCILQFRHCAQYTATHTRPWDLWSWNAANWKCMIFHIWLDVTIKWVDFGRPPQFYLLSFHIFSCSWTCGHASKWWSLNKLGVDTYRTW